MVTWYVPDGTVAGVLRRAIAVAGVAGDGRLDVQRLPDELRHPGEDAA
jgi:hypothetical protein